MERRLPLWVVLLVILLGIILLVLFGSLVRGSIMNAQERSTLGNAAIEIAEFPSLVGDVFAHIFDPPPRYAELQAPRFETDLANYRPLKVAPGLTVSPPLYRASEGALPGWRVLVGAFVIGGEVAHAALLISPDYEIRHYWLLKEPAKEEIGARETERKLPHGFSLLPDGSVIFTFNYARTLQRFSFCSERLWTALGVYHHAVTLTEDGKSLWTLRQGPDFGTWHGEVPAPLSKPLGDVAEESWVVQIDVSDGTVLREFSMQDVIDANPGIDVLEIMRPHADDSGGNHPQMPGEWLNDPFHLNDVDPLPAKMAEAFPDFRAGDLLLSSRSLNLVMVLDPTTLEIRWWRIGATQRQHDPDWRPNGWISVYNNRMARGRSDILMIDPETYRTRVSHDGATTGFYSRIRGKHQHLPNADIMITSSQQGRILEVAGDGTLRLEILNVDPEESGMVYVVTEAIWLAPEALSLPETSCE